MLPAMTNNRRGEVETNQRYECYFSIRDVTVADAYACGLSVGKYCYGPTGLRGECLAMASEKGQAVLQAEREDAEKRR